MGWTFTKTSETAKQYLDREFKDCSGTEFHNKLLASGINKGVWYGAIETTPKEGVVGPKQVWCLVCLYSQKKDKTSIYGMLNEIGYKDISEMAGPIYYDCPKGVWKVLQENQEFAPDNYYSQEWRKQVAKRIANPHKPLEIGQKIKFNYELKFGGQYLENTFIVLSAGRNKVFQSSKYGFVCKLSRETLNEANYDVVSE